MPRKKTPEEYYNECKEKGLDLPIEDYKGSKVKIKHKCKYGHIYEQKPNGHLDGNGCSVCSGNKKKTPKEYVQECKEKHLDPPIEDYINNNTKIKHKCKYGHIYKQKPNSHLQGKGCTVCRGKQIKTAQEYYNLCKINFYDVPIDNYKNSSTEMKFKCNKGHIYDQRASSHLEGYGCPICNESHGEKFIRNYLEENHIKYVSQKKFKDLKDKTYLSYDFYLPDYNMLIEYQGIQHYQTNDYFGGKERLNKQQYHDKLKKDYAKNNGYKLLELHYSLDTQEKVNTYLSRRIKD